MERYWDTFHDYREAGIQKNTVRWKNKKLYWHDITNCSFAYKSGPYLPPEGLITIFENKVRSFSVLKQSKAWIKIEYINYKSNCFYLSTYRIINAKCYIKLFFLNTVKARFYLYGLSVHVICSSTIFRIALLLACNIVHAQYTSWDAIYGTSAVSYCIARSDIMLGLELHRRCRT